MRIPHKQPTQAGYNWTQAVAWVGNRLWTFRQRRNRQASHELALFVFFNVVAMIISVACLGVSRYIFGLHPQLTDNLTNIFGIGFGTLFRFWSNRKFVFAGTPGEEAPEPRPRRAGPDSSNRKGALCSRHPPTWFHAGPDTAELGVVCHDPAGEPENVSKY